MKSKRPQFAVTPKNSSLFSVMNYVEDSPRLLGAQVLGDLGKAMLVGCKASQIALLDSQARLIVESLVFDDIDPLENLFNDKHQSDD